MTQAIQRTTSDVNAPSSNTAAVLTYAAVSDRRHVLDGVQFSYSGGTPTGGNLKVEDGAGTTVLSLDVTAAGHGWVPFAPGLAGRVNTAMIVTLAAGGSGVSGKLNAAHRLE
jgi:hypothetical protein